MKKNKSFKALGDLLSDDAFQKIKNAPSSSKKRFDDDVFDFLTLIENWHEVIGEKLSKFTIPLKIQGGQLTILSNHSAFAQQLGFLEEQIKENIFKKYPALKKSIKRIRFQNNPRHFEQQRTIHKRRIEKVKEEEPIEIHPHSPRYKELKKKAIQIFSDFEDGDIKDHLISIYIQGNYFND